MSEKTLVILDASAMSQSGCILRLFRTVVEGYRPKLNTNVIEFGSSFHLFRKIFREKSDVGLAEGINIAKEYFTTVPMVEVPNKKYLTPVFLMRICIEYAEKYAKDSFKPIWVDTEKGREPLLELKFAFPYYVDDEMEILIAGTIDEIGKKKNGIVSLVDAKTTAMWDIKSYFQSFELSPQLRFYKWALFKYAEAYPESFVAQLCSDIIGCQIDGIFYKGADKEVEYKRSDVMLFQDDPKMKEFDRLVAQKVVQLIEAIKWWKNHNKTPMREGMLNGSCQTKYGLCNFFTSCSAVDETTRNVILDYNFIKKPYNPLLFH